MGSTSKRVLIWLGLAGVALPIAATGQIPIPEPDLTQLEPMVAAQITDMVSTLEEVVETAKTEDQEKAQVFAELGRVYHAYGLWESAEAAYLNAMILDPAEYNWHHLLGLVHRDSGDLPGAVRYFQSALTIEPGRVPPLIYLGEVLLELNRIDEAEEALMEALGGEPRSAAALAALGQVALSRQQYEVAVERFQAALAEVPEATRLHYPLGMAYRGLGDRAKAREHLEQAGEVGVKPADPLAEGLTDRLVGERVFLLRGKMAFEAGRYAEAETAFASALAANPESVRALVNHAVALQALGHEEEAASELQRAVLLDPKSTTARVNLGTMLSRAGDPQGALTHFEVAVAISPVDEEALLGKARSLVELGRFAEARELLDHASGLLPESGRIAFALSRLLSECPVLDLRDGERALQLAERVFAAEASIGHAALVASALAELDRCEEALNWQQEALRAAGERGDPALTEQLASALERYRSSRPCRSAGVVAVN